MCTKNAVSTIVYFLDGKYRKRVPNQKVWPWLKNRYSGTKDEDDWGYTVDIEHMYQEAEWALDARQKAMTTPRLPTAHRDPHLTNPRDIGPDLMFGPYIMMDHDMSSYSHKVDLSMGLSDRCFIGLKVYDLDEEKRKKSSKLKEKYKKERRKEKRSSVDYVFLHATRMDKLPYFLTSPVRGIPYELQLYTSTQKGKKLEGFESWYVVDTQGEVHETYAKQTCYQRIRQKGAEAFHIPNTSLSSTDIFTGAIGSKDSRYNGPNLLAIALNYYQLIDLNWYLRFSDPKRGTVNISITPKLAKVAFKDRKKVKTKTGRMKPIVHWVTSHTRVNGANVKTYIKGLMDFKWRDLDISIKLPGKHLDMLTKMTTVSGSEVYGEVPWYYKISKVLEQKYIDKKVKEHNDSLEHRTLPLTGEDITFVAMTNKQNKELEKEKEEFLNEYKNTREIAI